jgi:transcriptional regulator with XRE-family HTH domain
MELFLRPRLKDLSQGSRICYVRQLRGMTQDELASKLGFTDDRKRRHITRYETNERIPKDDRLEELAKILNVSVNAIKTYDYINPNDLIYINIWMEELIPGYKIDLDTLDKTWFDSVKYLKLFVRDWKEMNQKLENKEISLKEYIEWKLNIDVIELETNRICNKINMFVEQER